ncbi:MULTISPECIES: SDR family oxidoreductase [unclassified Leptolyngbya]|uniref:SDR family oxidoreductase n=1 Tax=unclassified Leptolyngbya TaxID=2650499 RepID=UPI001686E340|nr:MULTISPECIES: SDR family oxidoreductase [unclassified Leptolyngbya]MBD1913217.1 SDR family oxidoreductase [Leptolyngbya sp. FACHB-8]MBD2155679.1 SDR family oxidoreductase [Leptolyngbya sp. FACHB-16]
MGGTSGIGKSVAQLLLQGDGSVVLIGKRAEKLQAAVTELQKSGLHSLTQHLAMELASQGIRVNAVSPAVHSLFRKTKR